MNTTVWKFSLGPPKDRDVHPECDVAMPGGARVLAIGEHDGERVVWAEVDPQATVVTHRIYLVGTGRQIPPGSPVFVQTYIATNGYVWHVYDGGDLP